MKIQNLFLMELQAVHEEKTSHLLVIADDSEKMSYLLIGQNLQHMGG